MKKTSIRPDRDEYLTHTLLSGRVLGYARYGVEESPYPPVFYMYGFPGTRLEVAPDSGILSKNKLRVLVIDRPGLGTSTPHKDRTLLSFADDVLTIADHLEIQSFAVVGVSGGAPYALACAAAISSERLVSVGVVAGLGPYNLATSDEVWQSLRWSNKFLFWGPLHTPTLFQAVWRLSMPLTLGAAKLRSFFKASLERLSSSMQSSPQGLPPFYEVETDQDVRELRECLSRPNWSTYHFEELMLFLRDYGFELKNIESNRIIMWYGSKDVNIPPQLGRLMHAEIPKSELREVEGLDHSTMLKSTPKLIGELLGVEYWVD